MLEYFPGRNDYQIKNRYNQCLKRRLLKGEFDKYIAVDTTYPLTDQEQEDVDIISLCKANSERIISKADGEATEMCTPNKRVINESSGNFNIVKFA